MTIHEIRTPLAPADVIERARSFFALAASPSAAFPERQEPGFLKLHMEVGEIVVAAIAQGGSTCVRGSASRGAHLLTRFLTTLSVPMAASEAVHRRGHRTERGTRAESYPVHRVDAPAGPAPAPIAAQAA